MPYNKHGQWYLTDEAREILRDDDAETSELEDAFRKSGDLKAGQTIVNLWDQGKDKWEDRDAEGLTSSQIFGVLQEYEKYITTGKGKDWENGVPPAGDVGGVEWGLGIEREKGGNDLEFDNKDPDVIMNMLLGYHKDDYDIDYAHYNSNLAYRSTMARLHTDKTLGFTDQRSNFTTRNQILRAQAILREPGYDYDDNWVRQNAMPYKDYELEAMEDFKKFNQTRHFDEEYNITTYLDQADSRALDTKLRDARSKGNFRRITEPGQPENLNIVGGSAPKEVYNAQGDRVIADGDVQSLYQRYLGRDYNKLQDKNLDKTAKDYNPKAIGKDEIAFWEKEAKDNDWTYDEVAGHIQNSDEGLQNSDKGRLFYNPNFDKAAKISAKIAKDPTQTNAITPPTLTIRQLKGGVKKPSASSNLDGFNVPIPKTGA